MTSLKDFSLYNIDWNLSPEHAVTMYLEWGNNDWHSEYPPVRSKDDVSHYFVVDSWQEPPVIRLVKETEIPIRQFLPTRTGATSRITQLKLKKTLSPMIRLVP